MSWRIVKEVFDNAPDDLKPLELLVLVALAEAAHDRDRTAMENSSADAVAFRVRSTPGSVRNVLLSLKMRGLIRPMHKRPSRGQSQNWIIANLNGHHRNATIREPPDP